MSKGKQLVPIVEKMSDLEYWDRMAREHQELVPFALDPEPEPEPLPVPAPPVGDFFRVVKFFINYEDSTDPGDNRVLLADSELDNIEYLKDGDDVVEEQGDLVIVFQWPFTQTINRRSHVLSSPWRRKDLLRFILHELATIEDLCLSLALDGHGNQDTRSSLLGICRYLDECEVVMAIQQEPRRWFVILEEHV